MSAAWSYRDEGPWVVVEFRAGPDLAELFYPGDLVPPAAEMGPDEDGVWTPGPNPSRPETMEAFVGLGLYLMGVGGLAGLLRVNGLAVRLPEGAPATGAPVGLRETPLVVEAEGTLADLLKHK